MAERGFGGGWGHLAGLLRFLSVDCSVGQGREKVQRGTTGHFAAAAENFASPACLNNSLQEKYFLTNKTPVLPPDRLA
jgi:hypothetical protein